MDNQTDKTIEVDVPETEPLEEVDGEKKKRTYTDAMRRASSKYHVKKYNTDPEYRKRQNERVIAWKKRNPEKVKEYARNHSRRAYAELKLLREMKGVLDKFNEKLRV